VAKAYRSTLLAMASWAAALLACSPTVAAPTPPSCTSGYTFAFFNGVGNTVADADLGLTALRYYTAYNAGVTQGPNWTYDPSGGVDPPLPVNFEVFYNTTSAFGADVAEVFVQRAQEDDPSGQLGNKYLFLMWDTVSGYSNAVLNTQGFASYVQNFSLATLNLLTDALAALVTAIPPTESDLAQQQAQLDADISSGQRMLMVAHSQGNLFVNIAYDYANAITSPGQLGVVHIAPASATLRGKYLLSSRDLVINGLRLKGVNSVVDNNATLQAFPGNPDPTGHTLVDTYLSATTGGLPLVQPLVSAAWMNLSGLPTCGLKLLPRTSAVSLGGNESLTAVLNATPASGATVTYDWTISGKGEGFFIDPATQAHTTTLTTSSAVVTYNATTSAQDTGNQDTLTVVANVTDPGTSAKTVQLMSLPAVITLESQAALTPTNPPVFPGGSVVFSASVPGAVSTTGYSYKWSNSASAGTLSGPGSSVNPANYCSSSAQSTYTANSNAAVGQTDSIAVQVFTGGNCDITKGQALNPVSTTVTIKPVEALITPAGPMVQPDSTTTFTVSIAPLTLPAGGSYQWTLSGAGSIGSGATVTTAAPSLSYSAPSTAGSATLAVSVLDSTGTVIAKAATLITIGVDLTPWLGTWNCPPNANGLGATVQIFGAPFTAAQISQFGPPNSSQTNLLAQASLTQNGNFAGIVFDYFIAGATTAIDDRNASDPNYNQTLTLTGSTLVGGGNFSILPGVPCTR
jgi:hypothetical protein